MTNTTKHLGSAEHVNRAPVKTALDAAELKATSTSVNVAESVDEKKLRRIEYVLQSMPFTVGHIARQEENTDCFARDTRFSRPQSTPFPRGPGGAMRLFCSAEQLNKLDFKRNFPSL